MFRDRSILILFVDPCVVIFLVSIWIKGALSLEIDEAYFVNNIDDDGSYGWDSGAEVYTKTITADNLDFSIDNDGKLHAKLKPFRPFGFYDFEFQENLTLLFRHNFESHNWYKSRSIFYRHFYHKVIITNNPNKATLIALLAAKLSIREKENNCN